MIKNSLLMGGMGYLLPMFHYIIMYNYTLHLLFIKSLQIKKHGQQVARATHFNYVFLCK